MANTRDKVYDAAGNVKPYVERAMSDEKLREDVMSAFTTAKELYNELIGGRGAVTLATRVATDDDVRDKLKEAVEDLRQRGRPAAGQEGAPRRATRRCSSRASRSASSSTRSPARRRAAG